MDREMARAHFKNLGLSYEKINKEDINCLLEIISSELSSYLEHGGEYAQQMDMKLSKLRLKDVKVLKKGLQYARIQIDGSYFKRREAITFSSTGFIGFGGELSDSNVDPILKAFCKWCDKIIENKKAATLDVLQDALDSLMTECRNWMYVVPHTNQRGFSTDKEYFFNHEEFKMFRTPDEVGIAVKNDKGTFEHFSYTEFLSFFVRT
ncbi:hypothetical protein [Bacillus thuringiensis]|uniref:hypothetical protein n=1 Tax=Bacillus thuringiensis TaxID=1428 RepID=UPI0020D2032D|nr:hypothetical protein [Bacillus thuringiensis]